MDMRNIVMVGGLCLVGLSQSNLMLAESASQAAVVTMRDNSFNPPTMTIKAGESVTWVNMGNKIHNVMGPRGTFAFDHIKPGESVSYTFTKPGVYPYKCSRHTILFFGMKGKVVVQ